VTRERSESIVRASGQRVKESSESAEVDLLDFYSRREQGGDEPR